MWLIISLVLIGVALVGGGITFAVSATRSDSSQSSNANQNNNSNSQKNEKTVELPTNDKMIENMKTAFKEMGFSNDNNNQQNNTPIVTPHVDYGIIENAIQEGINHVNYTIDDKLDVMHNEINQQKGENQIFLNNINDKINTLESQTGNISNLYNEKFNEFKQTLNDVVNKNLNTMLPLIDQQHKAEEEIKNIKTKALEHINNQNNDNKEQQLFIQILDYCNKLDVSDKQAMYKAFAETLDEFINMDTTMLKAEKATVDNIQKELKDKRVSLEKEVEKDDANHTHIKHEANETKNQVIKKCLKQLIFATKEKYKESKFKTMIRRFIGIFSFKKNGNDIQEFDRANTKILADLCQNESFNNKLKEKLIGYNYNLFLDFMTTLHNKNTNIASNLDIYKKNDPDQYDKTNKKHLVDDNPLQNAPQDKASFDEIEDNEEENVKQSDNVHKRNTFKNLLYEKRDIDIVNNEYRMFEEYINDNKKETNYPNLNNIIKTLSKNEANYATTVGQLIGNIQAKLNVQLNPQQLNKEEEIIKKLFLTQPVGAVAPIALSIKPANEAKKNVIVRDMINLYKAEKKLEELQSKFEQQNQHI